ATGIDIQPIKDAKEKWGFNYKNMDLSEFSDEDPNYKTQFENKDLVIATGLDGHGMRDRYENTMSLTKELDKYFNLLRGIKEMNKKETLYFLGIPSLYQYQSHFLKNHNISADVIERTNPKFAKKFCDSKMKELGFNLLFKDKIKKNGFYKPIKD
ncbi:MAG: hypothetical protein NTZ83_03910, partial [Candidatus Pacearchaeota archaeon]|nr:hypothetical protein [Candidatus Pacearchaeota archaeon]